MRRDHPQRLVIHIGDPKTGTSSIQRVLQMGLFQDASTAPGKRVSPLLDRLNSANAIGLARSFSKDGPPTRSIRKFEKWIRRENADILIVSSEFFYKADPILLRRYLEGRHPDLVRDSRIIAYVRPYLGRALSAFIERTKAGYTLLNFEPWLEKFIKLGSLHYADRFESWRASFGENFVLRPYIRSEMINQDAVADFFSQAFGAQDLPVRQGVNENQKISLKALAGLRYFNTAMAEAGLDPKYRIPLSLMVSRYLETSPSASLPQIGPESGKRIWRACRHDAERMDRDFFGRPLFLPDLQQGVADCSATALNLSLDRNFDRSEQDEIARMVSGIVGIVPRRFSGWMAFYKVFSARYNLGIGKPKGGGALQEMLISLAGRLS